MKSNIVFEARYNGKTYTFGYGSEVYIFHTGIYNEMDKKYGFKDLLNYVSLVHTCYLSDSNRTPLGALADYVAENWSKVKTMSKSALLKKFYLKNGDIL